MKNGENPTILMVDVNIGLPQIGWVEGKHLDLPIPSHHPIHPIHMTHTTGGCKEWEDSRVFGGNSPDRCVENIYGVSADRKAL